MTTISIARTGVAPMNSPNSARSFNARPCLPPPECEPLAHLSAKVAVVIKAQERHDYKLDQIACTQEAILDTLVAILRTGAI
jgi:hypothetical protein